MDGGYEQNATVSYLQRQAHTGPVAAGTDTGHDDAACTLNGNEPTTMASSSPPWRQRHGHNDASTGAARSQRKSSLHNLPRRSGLVQRRSRRAESMENSCSGPATDWMASIAAHDAAG